MTLLHTKSTSGNSGSVIGIFLASCTEAKRSWVASGGPIAPSSPATGVLTSWSAPLTLTPRSYRCTMSSAVEGQLRYEQEK